MMELITYPGTICCGECGYAVRPESLDLEAPRAIGVCCTNYKCAEKGKRYVLPATIVQVEAA